MKITTRLLFFSSFSVFPWLSSSAALGLFLLLAACTQSESFSTFSVSTPNSGSSHFSAAQLASPPGDGWITNGGSLANQRWSPLDKINRDNVTQLKGVWRTHLEGAGMGARNSGEAQPLVHNGVIYTVTGQDDVFAISVSSGEILWRYSADFPEGLGPSICCSWISRGLGLGEDKIFVGQLDGKIVALDQASGEIVWQVQAQRWQEGYSITSAPLYYEGMVITGFAGGEYGIRGSVQAYSANSGEHLWTFYTVPGPAEFGHDTWPEGSEVWKYGGGAVWQTPAVDPDLGLLYFSTGNPGPDFNGSLREGDNLFTASIVALDVHTGEYRWHFQQVHHDIWDYDSSNPVVLFDLMLNGKSRRGLAQASKTGWVYILDRVTGEPLIGIEERQVPGNAYQLTSPTQPYPIGDSFVPQFIDIAPEGVDLVNQGRIFTPFGPGEVVMVQPSPAGSANWAPSAYDPNRQIMYVCAAESAMTLKVDDPAIELPLEADDKHFTGGGFAGIARSQGGVISALDMTNNKLVWQYRWPDICYSGFVSTAGDLLFVGKNDGHLTALDIETGHELWSFQTGAGMNSTVSVFEENGEQFIVAYSAGNVFAGSYHGDSIWLFSLQGEMRETTEGDTVKALAQVKAELSGGIDVVFVEGVPDLLAGKLLYTQTCLPCHGEDGLSGHGGGAPLNKLTDIRDVISTVTLGRNTMPTFYGALTPEQIRDVSGFVLEGLF